MTKNIWCEKNKTTDKKILMCGSAWSKDLGISESKAIMSAKLKIADVTSHTMVRSEKVMHKESTKGVVKSYEMNADNQLIDSKTFDKIVLGKKLANSLFSELLELVDSIKFVYLV